MSKWISVTERLPDKDGIYLCCSDDKQIDVLRFVNGEFEINIGDYIFGFNVSHWMPLPKLPKGE